MIYQGRASAAHFLNLKAGHVTYAHMGGHAHVTFGATYSTMRRPHTSISCYLVAFWT
jgi:hypothetical protein